MNVHKILIVDPDKNFIEFCRRCLEPKGWEIYPALTGVEALTLIQTHAFDVAVTAFSLPDIGGLDVLRSLKESEPDTPILLSSGREKIPVQQIAETIRLDPVALIEKPCAPQALVDIVQDALKRYGPGPVRGNLHGLSLTGLISMLCNEGKSASLEIQSSDRQATLFFDKGQVVHAVLDEQVGEEVVFTALTWETGDFALLMGDTTPEQTIYTSWSGLLLEGLRRIDETSFIQEQAALDGEGFALGQSPELEDPFFSTPARPPVFDIDSETQDAIETRLEHLYHDLRPRCILFAAHSGRLLHMRGMMDRHEALPLAALVAGSFSAIGEIADMIALEDEDRKFDQSLQEGSDFSLYLAKVKPSWVLAVAFNADTSLGLARQLTLQAAVDLEVLLAKAQVAAEKRQELSNKMDEAFLTEVSDALGDLFN